MKLAIMERGVTFPTRLVVLGQSQCTGSVGQSEQTALVGKEGRLREAGHRGPTIMYSILKIMFLNNV